MNQTDAFDKQIQRKFNCPEVEGQHYFAMPAEHLQSRHSQKSEYNKH